jgi:hypothetical protein
MVFLQQVIDQTKKENPEHIKDELGYVDVLGNSACLHEESP